MADLGLPGLGLGLSCRVPRVPPWLGRSVVGVLCLLALAGGSDAETKPPKVIRPPFRAKAPAAAKAGAKAAAKATSKATAKAAAKSSATAQAKTQAKAQAKTQAKAQAKTQAKTPSKLAKAQPKASAKAETKRKLPLPKKLQQPPPPKRSIWLPRLQNQEESKGREVKIVVVVPANALVGTFAICHLFSGPSSLLPCRAVAETPFMSLSPCSPPQRQGLSSAREENVLGRAAQCKRNKKKTKCRTCEILRPSYRKTVRRTVRQPAQPATTKQGSRPTALGFGHSNEDNNSGSKISSDAEGAWLDKKLHCINA